MSDPRLPVVVLISGAGSNLQALIDDNRQADAPLDIRAVISNRPAAAGLARARAAGIPAEVIDHTLYDSRDRYDAALQAAIDCYQPGLVVLAGFMRILTPAFVHHYLGRMLNIHPSLLPHYSGLQTHRRVLAAGGAEHGASVHFVTEQLDGGPVILQGRVPVLATDTEATLAARVHGVEHRIYPLAIRWFAQGRLHLHAGGAYLDGRLLPPHGATLP